MRVTSVPPHITDVDPNSAEFREALALAGIILAGTGLNVYSRHSHYPVGAGELLFEELVMPGQLALYPVSAAEAVANGLPSCWAFTPDGTVVVQRYAHRSLHEGSGIDVTSAEFLAHLAEIGRAFAAQGLDTVLELNIAGYLFPNGEGTVTLEVTDEAARMQRVTIAPITDELLNDNWALAACWGFSPEGEPAVTGMCATDGGMVSHR